jgi:hypothetical protein
LDRRLGRSQNRSGRRGEEKILDPTGTRTPTPQPFSPQPVAIPTALSQLHKHMKEGKKNISRKEQKRKRKKQINEGIK